MSQVSEMDGKVVLKAWPECAKLLGVSKPTLYRLLREGRIPSFRLGRLWFIPVKALNEMIETASKRGGDG